MEQQLEREKVDVYKTSIESVQQRDLLLKILQEYFPTCRINVDLQDCDKVLRIACSGETPNLRMLHSITRSVGVWIEELE